MRQDSRDPSGTPRSPVIQGDLIDLLEDSDPDRLKSLILEGASSVQSAGTLPYKSAPPFTYAVAYCRGGNDCPDTGFELDCTHFLSHCLAAGGVSVSSPSAQCRKRLCIRANDLAAALSNSVGKYSNVKRIDSHRSTRRGDICFIPGWFGLSKVHAMLLASTATPSGAMVFAHTNNRCGEFVGFEGAVCAYYRIEDA